MTKTEIAFQRIADSQSGRRILSSLFAGFLAAALLGSGWIVPYVGLLGPIAFAVLLHEIIRYQPSLRWTIFYSLAFGIITFVVACFWFPDTVAALEEWEWSKRTLASSVIWICLGLQLTIFCLMLKFLIIDRRSSLVFAVPIWIALASVWPMPFPWRLGYWFADLPVLCQIADLGGEPMVTAFFMSIALLVVAWNPFHRGQQDENTPATTHAVPALSKSEIHVLLAFTFFCLIYGGYQWSQWRSENTNSTREVRIAAIQHDIGRVDAGLELIELTQSIPGKIDLVLWPECSVGNYDILLESFADAREVESLSAGVGKRSPPMPGGGFALLAGGNTVELIGGVMVAKTPTAFLIDTHERIVARHQKVKLMPFGEFFPGPMWLQNMLFSEEDEEEDLELLEVNAVDPSTDVSMLADEELPDEEELHEPREAKYYTPGKNAAPLVLSEDIRIGAQLCCEDMYSGVSQALASRGANLLICLCNGTMFNYTAPLNQHFRMARFRAIENRLPLVRCGNVGVTGFISPAGEVRERLNCWTNGSLRVNVPVETNHSPTLFTRFGNWPIPVSYLLVGFLLVRYLRISKQP